MISKDLHDDDEDEDEEMLETADGESMNTEESNQGLMIWKWKQLIKLKAFKILVLVTNFKKNFKNVC